jgi:glycosyltransferase involved in cell wall biosynthesis
VNDRTTVLHVLAPMREGGLERVVIMLSAAQRATSVHVAAVISERAADAHPFVLQLNALGVAVTPVVVGARNYFREYQALSSLVARLRPLVVHTHGYRADVIAGAVARSRRIPIVSTVHGFTGGGLRNWLYERLQAFALKRADAVIAVSRSLAERLTREGVPSARISLIPNGFVPLFDLLPRDAARRRLGISSGALVAGWVGRLSKEKGADVMLSALTEAGPRWQLSIIGDGDEFAALRSQAAALRLEDRINWHGAIAEAGSLLTAFDAFVLSSRTEGTPITLLEAMNAGVPIVATRVGGVPDVIDSSHGILVPPENPRMLARALSEVEREPAVAAARCRRAKERLAHSYGAAWWQSAVGSVYAAVIGLEVNNKPSKKQ